MPKVALILHLKSNHPLGWLLFWCVQLGENSGVALQLHFLVRVKTLIHSTPSNHTEIFGRPHSPFDVFTTYAD